MNRFASCLNSCLLVIGVVLIVLAIAYVSLAKVGRIDRTIGQIKNSIAQANEKFNSNSESIDLTQKQNVLVPILNYHYVREVNPNEDLLGYGLSVAKEDFEAQLIAFQDAGFNTITANDFLDGNFDEHSIMITFDDGYSDFFYDAYPLLRKYAMKAVIFVVAGFMDDDEKRYLTSEQVTTISADDIEIGSHSVTHANLTKLSDKKLQDELLMSRFALEKVAKNRVTAFAYPSGHYDEKVTRMADFVGYKFGVTTEFGAAKINSEHLTLPRIKVNGGETTDQILRKIDQAKKNSDTSY